MVFLCEISQDVCPYNHKFSQSLSELAFAARPALKGKDARALSCELPAMSPLEFSVAFKGSPMKRVELRGVERDAAVVLGNIGNADDVELLHRSLVSDEALVREHARLALAKIGTPEVLDALRAPVPCGQRSRQAVGMVPPSMTYSVPVIAPARLDTRKVIKSATSCGFAGRPSGIPPRPFMMISLPPS